MRMPTISRARAAVYVVVALLALVAGGRFVLGGDSGAAEPGETLAALEPLPGESGELAAAPSDSGQPPRKAARKLVVHVVGAVRRPGLYRLAEGSRIDDAIRRAGGPTRRAELALVNLAAPVSDGAQILVPARGRSGGAGVAAGALAPPGSSVTGPVHLNTATLEELDVLPGVGPVTAQRILDYREQHGPFTSVEELDAVPGIGPARLEQLRELVEP